MLQIDKHQQLTLAKVILRRTHSNAAKILGERLSVEDNSLLTKFDNFHSRFYEPMGINPNPLGPKIKYVSKNKLRKAIQIAFTKAFGSQCVKILTAEEGWDPYFEMKFAGWNVATAFSFGRHRDQGNISYGHSINSETKTPIQEIPPECWPPTTRLGYWLSFLIGLGVIGPPQGLSFLKKEEVDQACDIIIKCCGRFFEAVPRLLSGLEFEKITTE